MMVQESGRTLAKGHFDDDRGSVMSEQTATAHLEQARMSKSCCPREIQKEDTKDRQQLWRDQGLTVYQR